MECKATDILIHHCFRFPQEVYRTAKVSKILLAINSGKSQDFEGKTLEEIEVSDNDECDSDSESFKIGYSKIGDIQATSLKDRRQNGTYKN